MKQKHFNILIEVLFLSLLFLAAVIFDRRIGIVFSLTKATTIRFFTILIFSAWTIKILIFKEHKFVRTLLDWPVLSYLLACTIAAITSIHVYISLFGFYGRFEGLITLYNFGLLFFITTNYITDLRAIKRLVATICSAGVLMSIYAIIQRNGIDPYAWGGVVTWERVIATIGQPNFFAAYADMAFLLTLFLYLAPKKKMPFTLESSLPVIYFLIPLLTFILMIYNLGTQSVFLWYFGFALCSLFAIWFAFKFEDMPPLLGDILWGVSLVLLYTALFYTQSRGGFLGLFAALSLFFIIGPRRIIIKNWKKLGILFMALALVTGITISDPQFSLFSRMSGEIKIEQPKENEKSEIEFEGAAGSRGETWKSAFRIISDYPVFGIGPEVLKMVFPRYETELFRFKEAFHVKQDRSHNETLDVPVTRGLVSFFAYLLVLFLVFWRGIISLNRVSEEKKLILTSFLCATAAYIIQNQFSFGVVAITSLFWVMWGVIVKVEDLPEEKSEKNKDKKIGFDDIPWIPAAIVIAATIILIFVSSIPFRADKEFKTGKTLSGVKRFKEAITYYDRSLKLQPFEGGSITHKGISLINFAAKTKPESRGAIYKEAIETLQFGTLVDPYNADNFYILSRIYFIQNKLDPAVEAADKALKIDPYYAEVYLLLSKIAERRGEFTKVKAYSKEAYRINPGLPEAKEKMIWNLIDKGELKDAFQLVQEILMENPKYVNAYNALGTIYLRKGMKKKAIEAFETALSLDPNNRYARWMLKR